MVNRFRTRLWPVVCAMLASLATGGARAAEWWAQPSADLRTEYDSNLHLTSAPHSGVWGLSLSPDVKFGGATEALDVNGGLRFNFNRYSEHSEDTNDYIFGLRSNYRGERDVVGFNADAVRDSTLVSELAQTGVVLSRAQRNRFTANPSWTRALTERTSFVASYTYSNVRYGNTSGTGLVDYRDQTAAAGLQSKLSDRETGSVTAYYERYDTDQSRANTYGAQIAYDRALSETVHGSIAAGVRRTHNALFAHALVCDGPVFFGICFGNLTTLNATASDTSTGYIFSAALEKKWETASVSGQLSRELNPSGVGTLVETDRFGATWAQQWSPTVSSSLYGAAYQTKAVGSFASASKSRYLTVEPQVSWRITEAWTLSAGYHYSRISYQQSGADAANNVAYLVASYAWPRRSVSR